ncbi:AfsA-related hotdog domain-containing protein [Fluviispira multicolorata]|uniref:A-factor biosynthesis hotdog domain-containing protein n=1 Tax=Fluviispira multicolorata TaxID=2654512 RepID=A0A833JCI1_9BACT|nr:AfsA-related hotdog domain-containing protein [Fluviispira multicolorata]KAB8030723.1 hypothetical protein GCL57_07045 [Fluviispira multicolorata]
MQNNYTMISNIQNNSINFNTHNININHKNKEIIYIVGDNFNEFSQSNYVITLSKFIHYIKDINKKSNNNLYYLGQGLSKSEKEIIIKYSVDYQFPVYLPENRLASESKDTHKTKKENILITCPQKIHNDLYQSHLIIDDSCAEMSDHVTGRHIQGMVLIEAARQMMLAISEKFILDYNNKGNFYCIWSNIVTKFNHFLFPIDVIIKHYITQIERHNNGTIKLKSITKFIQNNKVCSDIEIEYKLFNKYIMKKIEEEIAEKNLQNFSYKIKEKFIQVSSIENMS